MTFRAIALGNDGQTSNSTTITFTVPAGTVSGDVMTVGILTNSGPATYTVSGGGTSVSWTARSPGPRDQGDGSAINTEVWTATANGTSPSTTVTVTSSNSARDCGVLLVESGVLESGVLLAVTTSNTTPSTSWAFPSVTIPDNTGWSLIGLAMIRSSSTSAATLTAPGSYVVEGTATTAYVTAPQLSVSGIDASSTVASGSRSPGTGTLSTSQLVTTYTLGFAPSASNYTPSNTGSQIEADTASLAQGLARTKADLSDVEDAASTATAAARSNTGSVTAGDSATAVKGTAKSFTGTDSTTARDRYAIPATQALTGTSRSRAITAADEAMVQVHRTPVGLNLTTWHLHADGTQHRWMRDQITQPSTVPGVPNGVTLTNNGASADIFWAAPTFDGGSTITGYTVKRIGTGGSTQNLGATTFTAHFGSLTSGQSYQFSVAAVNANGTGPAVFISISTMRFPGDTNPKQTSRLFMGASVKNGGSPAPWENASGVPMGIRHRYDGGSPDAGPLAWPNGEFAKWIAEDHAAGRIPLVGWHLANDQWGLAAGGKFDAQLDAWFTGVETVRAPVYWIVDHEPEDGIASDYRAWMQHIRARMNIYAGIHGPFKRLVFLGCLQAATFAGSHGGIATWWPGDGIFDMMGIDGYAWDNTTALPSSPMTQAMAYCASHNQPFGWSEYGVRPTDPQGGAKMTNLYNLMTDGNHDCNFLAYFSVDGPAWMLNTNNNTYQTFLSELVDPSSIHFSNLGY